MKNGRAVHACNTEHRVDWEVPTVKQVETHYTRRRIIEAIHIKKQKVTSNLTVVDPSIQYGTPSSNTLSFNLIYSLIITFYHFYHLTFSDITQHN